MEKVNEIIADYKYVGKRNKVIQFEHTINLTGDSLVNVQPRRLPCGLREPVRKELETLLHNNIIEPSSSRKMVKFESRSIIECLIR